jgi:hypothetical protein
VILVNDVPVSRKHYHLDYGDHVTLILGSRGTPGPENLGLAVTAGSVPSIRFDGATWHLQFGAEAGHFTTNMHGFPLYAALIENPDKELMSLELEQKAGLRRPITEKGGQRDADTAVDPKGVQNIRDELERIQKEMDDTVNEERIAELKQEQQNVLACRDKLVNIHGRPRRIGPQADLERARMRVHNSLGRARELIAKSMPAFATQGPRSTDHPDSSPPVDFVKGQPLRFPRNDSVPGGNPWPQRPPLRTSRRPIPRFATTSPR